MLVGPWQLNEKLRTEHPGIHFYDPNPVVFSSVNCLKIWLSRAITSHGLLTLFLVISNNKYVSKKKK